MKIRTDDGFFDFREGDTSKIYVSAQLGSGEGFSKPVKFLLDTGNTGGTSIFIPRSLLQDLKIDLPPVVAESKSTLADGSSAGKESIVLLNVKVLSIPSARPIIFEGIKVSVSEDAPQPIINFAYCTMLIKNRELALLEFNPQSVGKD